MRRPATRPPAVGALLAALPEALPAMVASMVLAAMVLLDLGVLFSPLLYPLLVLAAGAAFVLVLRMQRADRSARGRRTWWWDAAALVVAAGFAAMNARYASQHLVVDRDPAIYNTAAGYLLHHHALPVHIDLGVFGDGVSIAGSGYGYAPGQGNLYPQGMHGVPVLAAAVGRIFGSGMLLRTDALVGGVSLLAFYAFVRTLMPRAFALVAMLVLGWSLPQLHFTRDTYSEPLGQLCAFAGLALLVRARRRSAPGPYAFAGLVFGATMLTRTDAFLGIVAAAAVVADLLLFARPRRRGVSLAVAFSAGVAVPAVVGLRDLQVLSPGYYRDLHKELATVFAADVLVVAAVLGVTAAAWAAPAVLRWAYQRRAQLAVGAGLLTLVVLAGLAARPLLGAHHGNSPADDPAVGAIQMREGLTVDPSRDYAYETVQWIAYYVGPLTVGLGLVGIAWLVHRAIRRPDGSLLPFLALFFPFALGYLLTPNISADQIWAVRRLLPVVIPGVIVGASFLLANVWRLALARLRSRAWTRPVGVGVAGAAAASALAGVALPIAISAPLLTVREYVPDLALVQSFCKIVGPDAAVVGLTGPGDTFSYTLDPAVTSFCHVPVARLPRPANKAMLLAQQQAAAARGRTLWVYSLLPSTLATAGTIDPQQQPTITAQPRQWDARLTAAPRHATTLQQQVYLARVRPDGGLAVAPPLSTGAVQAARG